MLVVVVRRCLLEIHSASQQARGKEGLQPMVCWASKTWETLALEAYDVTETCTRSGSSLNTIPYSLWHNMHGRLKHLHAMP